MSEVFGTIGPCCSLLLLLADVSCSRCRELVPRSWGDMNYNLPYAAFGLIGISGGLSATSCGLRRATASFRGGPHYRSVNHSKAVSRGCTMCFFCSLSCRFIHRPWSIFSIYPKRILVYRDAAESIFVAWSFWEVSTDIGWYKQALNNTHVWAVRLG